MAQAPARIGNVTEVTGNEVHVQVEYGLPGRGAAIYANVIAIRSVIFVDDFFRHIHGRYEGSPFLRIRFEPCRNMPPRY